MASFSDDPSASTLALSAVFCVPSCDLISDWDAANGAPSMLLSSAAKPSGQPDWYDPIYDIASHKGSGYHQMLNTGEHQEEALLQNLMASWQAGKTSNLSSALSDIGTQVKQIIARNK